MKKLWVRLLFALLLTTTFLAGADASGKWSGMAEMKNPEGETRTRPAYLILTQEGDKLSGSGGPNESRQFPIQNGKVEGERLTFEMVLPEGTMTFELKMKDDQMEGEVKGAMNNGTPVPVKISLKRVPAAEPAPPPSQPAQPKPPPA